MKYFIYKIIDKNNSNEFYIGSTNKVSARRSSHKKSTSNKVSKKYWCKLYQYIRSNGNWENFDFIILECGEVENKTDMKKKEQEYIDNLKPTLNTISSYLKR
jgi:group I intron endonuclease